MSCCSSVSVACVVRSDCGDVLFQIPLVVSGTQHCVLASWACACHTSCGLAQLIPESFEDFCGRVPANHWLVSLFWHPNFRPQCALDTLEETTVPNLLIILCSN